MPKLSVSVVCSLAFAAGMSSASAQTLTTLVNFYWSGSSSNGAWGCRNGLTVSGNTLYGTTDYYTPANRSFGTVFSVDVSGGPVNLLAVFNGADGSQPRGKLVLSGNALYGVTFRGGRTTGDDNGPGTAFSVPVTGGPVNVLTVFREDDPHNRTPTGAILSGDTLYVALSLASGRLTGGVCSVPVTGGPYTMLADFDGANGNSPRTLNVLGDTLYGVSLGAGANGLGTVFSIPISGGPVATLAAFNGTNGSNPRGVTVIGGNLYGTTRVGGAHNLGTVFSVPVNGGAITTLATFNGANGANPTIGELAVHGSTLYGTTSAGGASNLGTIFSVPITGGEITTLATFTESNGGQPNGDLVVSGNTLYGTTYSTVFALTLPCSAPIITSQPEATSTCLSDTATFSIATSGSTPAYQWQWQPAGVGTEWVNLVSGDNADVAGTPVVHATNIDAATLQARPLAGYINFAPRAFRCMVSNACGSNASSEATLTVCAADFNCDAAIDFFDYLDFVAAFSSQLPAADFNGDTVVDFFDYLDFVAAFSVGC